ncbi:transposable element Tcb1 transposase [Trichonephila clavipes]|nr:transposable element Tcb1 transposase [Trichonephila clavipes]
MKPNVFQRIPRNPLATQVKPRMAPIILWVPEIGSFKNVATMFHTALPKIELLPWPARSPDLSPIENMYSMVAQRSTQFTPPAATPDQLWQRVEAAWSAVPQDHI